MTRRGPVGRVLRRLACAAGLHAWLFAWAPVGGGYAAELRCRACRVPPSPGQERLRRLLCRLGLHGGQLMNGDPRDPGTWDLGPAEPVRVVLPAARAEAVGRQAAAGPRLVRERGRDRHRRPGPAVSNAPASVSRNEYLGPAVEECACCPAEIRPGDRCVRLEQDGLAVLVCLPCARGSDDRLVRALAS